MFLLARTSRSSGRLLSRPPVRGGCRQAAYQDFAALWKEADSEIPVLKQAKSEYAKLGWLSRIAFSTIRGMFGKLTKLGIQLFQGSEIRCMRLPFGRRAATNPEPRRPQYSSFVLPSRRSSGGMPQVDGHWGFCRSLIP